MNLKEAIKILAQFDELFGDGDDEDKKEIEWQFPEAWETEVVEMEWVGDAPDDVKEVMKRVGENPTKILRWGVENSDERAVRWALKNGADINRLGKDMLMNLHRFFSSDFMGEVIKKYAVDEKVRELIYNGMLEDGIDSGDDYKIQIALASGANIGKLDKDIVAYLCCYFSADFVKEIIEDYVRDEGVKRFVYGEMLKENIGDGDKNGVRIALEGGANINELDSEDLQDLGDRFPFDFIKEIEEKYSMSKEVKHIIYDRALWRAIVDGDRNAVREILANKRVDMDKVDRRAIMSLAMMFPVNFLKEVLEKYIEGGRMKRIVCEEILIDGMYRGSKRKVILALDNGMDLNKLDNYMLGKLCKSFPVNFIRRIISNYDVGGRAEDILLEDVFRRGLKEGRREDVIWALKNGVEVKQGDRRKLNTLLGSDWKKYLPRR